MDPVLRPRQCGGAARSQDRRADLVPARLRQEGRHPFGGARHSTAASGSRKPRSAGSASSIRPPSRSRNIRTRRCPTARAPARTPFASTSAGSCGSSGGPAISMFDPKTEKFQHYDLGGTYGNVVGKNGEQWFTSFRDRRPDRPGHQGRRAVEVLSADQGQAAAPARSMPTASSGSPSGAATRSAASIPRPRRSRNSRCPDRRRAPTRSASIAIA